MKNNTTDNQNKPKLTQEQLDTLRRQEELKNKYDYQKATAPYREEVHTFKTHYLKLMAKHNALVTETKASNKLNNTHWKNGTYISTQGMENAINLAIQKCGAEKVLYILRFVERIEAVAEKQTINLKPTTEKPHPKPQLYTTDANGNVVKKEDKKED